jgi:HTH-type transcriptional regulator/antitoxin HigA
MQSMIELIVLQFKNFTMAKINTEIQYEKALERVDELLRVVDNETNENDKNYIELDLLSDLVAEYEEKYFPVEKPSLPDIIRLRMAELKISQKKLATILNVSPSRISEYLSGKSEPTLKIARLLRDELKIDADIILG